MKNLRTIYTRKFHGENDFSLEHMRKIIELALESGYTFMTCREFMACDIAALPKRVFIMKHDLDAKPDTLWPLLQLETEMGVKPTVYVRVCAPDYNVMSLRVMPELVWWQNYGVEFGLHTNFVEYTKLAEVGQDINNTQLLRAEVQLLKNFLDIRGMSTHRDLNYAYNALPWLEEHWDDLKDVLDLDYQAYDPKLMDNTIYVNEGYSPHLCWRNITPEEAIATGKHIYMLTHPHWWWVTNPFESY